MISKKFKINAFIAASVVSLGALTALLKSPDSLADSKAGKVYGDWKVLCEKNEKTKKEVCFLQQGINVTQDNKQIPVATYQFTYDEKHNLKLIEILPQGILLQPGTSLIVGDKILGNAKFTVCQNNSCIAVADISKSDLGAILSKDTVAVGMFNNEGKQANLLFSTKGLKEGIDAIKSSK